MAFYKICGICGQKITFESRMKYPEYCPNDGSRMADYPTYEEGVDSVEQPVEEDKSDMERTTEAGGQAKTTGRGRFSLMLENGKEISIPEDGGIIGRKEIGAEELSEFPSVSRQHIKVYFRRNIGMLIEDISTYGTSVNGRILEKNIPEKVSPGSTITLCNVDAVVIERSGTAR